ncbi:hypothetical protein CDAR_91981 [Caerostris darwini]|uniref:Uncharacterized protein n=1 Tax=Caerostris darwini TaxID=1538125 RepID=A0AAV4QR82_9ARAC|nr:hypothetical protein CDAR_91981 [Caerostris darwini]
MPIPGTKVFHLASLIPGKCGLVPRKYVEQAAGRPSTRPFSGSPDFCLRRIWETLTNHALGKSSVFPTAASLRYLGDQACWVLRPDKASCARAVEENRGRLGHYARDGHLRRMPSLMKKLYKSQLKQEAAFVHCI